MRIGVLGTGTVGKAIATKLVELGHEVMMGSRSAENEALVEWVEGTGGRAVGGSFVANPLDFSRGMPPTLSVCNDDSLGEPDLLESFG